MMDKYFSGDPWLSQMLGKQAYRLDAAAEIAEVGDFGKWLQRAPFVYAKVATDAVPQIRFLQKNDFYLVDTNVIFDKLVDGQRQPSGICKVRSAIAEDREMAVAVAHDNFIYSRFHQDPLVSGEIANRIKAQWVENYFLGRRGEGMIVAAMSKKVVGFLQLLIQDEHLTIDLIGVDKNFQRLGIAADMIAYAESTYSHLSRIAVGTQIANTPSVRLYEKFGFRLCQSKYVFHYHRAEG